MNTKNKIMNQQGDSLSRKIDKLPANTKLIASEHIIVAHGESGHSHVIDYPNVELREDDNEIKYLVNNNKVEVPAIHEEHKIVTYVPGIHKLGLVREKDYFDDMIRPVID